MRIDFEPYAIVYTDHTDIYDVHFIVIDEKEKFLELNDANGFVIAGIHYEGIEEVGYLTYNEKERLTGDEHSLIKNGKLIFNPIF